MKLTPAQQAFLADVVRTGRQTCNESYLPAQKLVRLGLATYEQRSFGIWHVMPTHAGRAAMPSQERGK